MLLGNAAFLLNFVWISCPINSRNTTAAQIPVPPAMSLAGKEGHA
jgi:cytochrome c oxidase cbb3-type subunit 1